MEDVISFLPCSKATFYKYFPDNSDELNDLREMIESNKVSLKRRLRSKWEKSDNSTLQMALYKLTANPEERKALATNYNEHSGNDGEPIKHNHSIERHEVVFRDFSEKDADV